MSSRYPPEAHMPGRGARIPRHRRNPRRAYDSALKHYEIQHDTLFHEGKQNRMNGVGGAFWRGFNGEQQGTWDRASKGTIAYAYWCAGRDAAAAVR